MADGILLATVTRGPVSLQKAFIEGVLFDVRVAHVAQTQSLSPVAC
jgi:hypothetical protein